MKREFVKLLILSGLTLLSAGTATAQDEIAYKNQFVLSVSGGPLRKERTLDKFEEAVGEDLLALEIERSAALVVTADTESDELDDTEQLSPLDDLCRKSRKYRRAQLLAARSSVRAMVPPENIHCSPNYKVSASAVPNDSYFNTLWGMQQGSDIDIDAPEAWDMWTGSRSTIVAVIDTGVDYNHPDLAANMWVNTREIPGNSLDDDGNGVVDDVYGYNAITGSGNPMDDHGHGTHCSGTIGGVGNNGTGVAGVNWQVRIMAVKFLSATGGGSTYGAILGIDYVTAMRNRGENVILTSNSWGGGGFSQPLYDAVNRARTAGLLFVAAAGNSGQNSDVNPGYPAAMNLDNIVSVAALDQSGNLASFSNYGANSVDLAAPGVNISSSYPGNRYVYMSGTSMACPHVSGALALLNSYSNVMNWVELRDTLLRTVQPMGSLNGLVKTGGLLNARNMLVDALNNGKVGPTPTPSPTPTATPTGTPTPTPTPVATATPTPTAAPGYYQIGGRLIDDAGNTVKNAKLILRINGQTITRYSGENGEFSFGALYGPAYYTLEVKASGRAFYGYSAELRSHMSLNLTGVRTSHSLKILVLNENGAPVPGITTVLAEDPGDATTDINGKSVHALPYGSSYSISVSSDNHLFDRTVVGGVIYGDVERLFITVPR